jgi:uncharacterized phage-associated protein
VSVNTTKFVSLEREKMAKFQSYEDVSNYFIALSNESGSFISNLKLQKLMYYFQAWYYAAFEEKLFDKDFQAWVHGPVIPDLYHKYKHFGYKPIQKDLGEDTVKMFRESFNDDEQNFLNDIENFYFPKEGFELERLTHREDPWLNARKGLSIDAPCVNVISLDDMKVYYSKYIEG